MHLLTNIKMGEVSNLSDARFAAALGAEFIGFNLSPAHSEYVAPDLVAEISEWLLDPNLVAEWGNEPAEVIADTCERLDISYIQLNAFDEQQLKSLKAYNIIQNLTVTKKDGMEMVIKQIAAASAYVKFFMLSFESAKLQEFLLFEKNFTFTLKEFCKSYSVWLNFDFTSENLVETIAVFDPFGINLRGSRELKPGYKDFDELNELVQLLEIE